MGIFGDFSRVKYFDVDAYAWWSATILQTQQLPNDTGWQYPPGAAFLFLLPRLFVTPYQITFVVLLFAFDAAATFALVRLAQRTNRWLGVWFWILAITMTGNLAFLRFDIIPTAVVLVGLCMFAASGSNYAFGAVIGLAAAIKVWPVLLLTAASTTPRLLRQVTAAGIVVVAVFGAAHLLFGNPLAFISNQTGRGLEIESIAGTPWYIWELVTGQPVVSAIRNGSAEIVDPIADTVAHVLVGAMILLSVAIALWWWRARDQKRTVAASIDAVFAFTLLYILVSEVLSPQYLIWLIGIAAARLCLSPTKPVWWLALFALAVWLNGLMVDHWSDLVGEGGAGVVLLVGRNAILVAVAILSLSQVWRAARTQSVETIEATPAHTAAT